MPLEQTTTRLQSITSKSGQKQDGDMWTRYDFTLDGFRKPWSTFDKNLVDMSLQGKMVRASGSAEEKTFTPADSASPITFTQYTLQNIELVEGNVGTLDDVMAPIAAKENDQAVATTYTQGNGTPQSPSDAIKQADIRRAVALKSASELGRILLDSGETVTPAGVIVLAKQFETYLSGSERA